MKTRKDKKKVQKKYKKKVFTKKNYNSGEGMLTTVWGPSMWHYLHTMSFNYPVNPTLEHKKKHKEFIDNFRFDIRADQLPSLGNKIDESELKLSFIDWIKYSERKSNSGIDAKIPLGNKIKLIDDFIDKNPSISKVDKNQEITDIELENVFSPEELMTETLAKVFLKQKKYGKALKAYRILSLKYPEKNAFFAVQINKIKEIQDKE